MASLHQRDHSWELRYYSDECGAGCSQLYNATTTRRGLAWLGTAMRLAMHCHCYSCTEQNSRPHQRMLNTQSACGKAADGPCSHQRQHLHYSHYTYTGFCSRRVIPMPLCTPSLLRMFYKQQAMHQAFSTIPACLQEKPTPLLPRPRSAATTKLVSSDATDCLLPDVYCSHLCKPQADATCCPPNPLQTGTTTPPTTNSAWLRCHRSSDCTAAAAAPPCAHAWK